MKTTNSIIFDHKKDYRLGKIPFNMHVALMKDNKRVLESILGGFTKGNSYDYNYNDQFCTEGRSLVIRKGSCKIGNNC